MSTYKDLQAQIMKLQEQAASLHKAEKDAAIASIKEQMQSLGITVNDLGQTGSTKKDGKQRSSVAAKFRHPETGQTWSGRGRQPLWIGENSDIYLIK